MNYHTFLENPSKYKLAKRISVISFLLMLPYIICAADISLIEKISIADVWAGHPVNFAIKTTKDFQCVAFYNAKQKMVIAARKLGTTSWSYKELPTTIGWDSHNYISMAIDDSGYIHISGNMHNVNLIYFRSKKPWSIEEFESPGMIGSIENSVTYPEFIKNLENKLFFQYRDGGSGNGTTICNGYDIKTKKWSRITNKGLFDGENKVSAYYLSPILGPDNFFHVIWMWRETPVANTNFQISHMKSNDLVSWQTMSGQKLTLPVKSSTPGVVVDPIQSKRGLINMDYWISWDTQKRAVVTYHRYDNNNISQIFNTRWENSSWKIFQTSSWKSFKWNLDLEGSLTHDIAATPLFVDENGSLIQDYVYPKQTLHRWTLDEKTLKPQSDTPFTPPEALKPLYTVESSFPGMQVNRIRDGENGEYYLKWETMPINQDKARAAGTYPASSTLYLYRFSSEKTPIQKSNYQISGIISVIIKKNMITIEMAPNKLIKHNVYTASFFSANGKLLMKKLTSENNTITLPPMVFKTGIFILRISSPVAGTYEKIQYSEKIILD